MQKKPGLSELGFPGEERKPFHDIGGHDELDRRKLR
jgi:hypothetical protein